MSAVPKRDEIATLLPQVVNEVGVVCSGSGEARIKEDGSVVTELDYRLQGAITESLGARFPQIPLLGEEMPHSEQKAILEASHSGVWCLDPLDGTTNYSSGFPLFGVSLALIVGQQVILGVVYDPVRDEVFSAGEGAGAFLNGVPLATAGEHAINEAVAVVDYKRLTGRLAERLVRSPPYRSQRNLGSTVLEWCWLAAGRFQLYLHGGQKLWDYAAGSLVLKEAGGWSTSFDRNPMRFGSLVKRPVVAATDRDLYEQWMDWVEKNR